MCSQKITSLLSLIALLPLTSNCTYRESANSDSYVSSIVLADPPDLRSGDEAINRNSIDVNINPNVPKP